MIIIDIIEQFFLFSNKLSTSSMVEAVACTSLLTRPPVTTAGKRKKEGKEALSSQFGALVISLGYHSRLPP